jgi:Spy/CpxP family protein refolding chaperone
MRTVTALAVTGLVLSLAVASAPAQEKCSGCPAAHRHGPPALLLLSRKAIREDLKLTDEQNQRVRAALVKQITAFIDATDLPKEERAQKLPELRQQGNRIAAEILTPEQVARLRQIRLQVQGPRAFLNPEMVQKLSITDAQREKIIGTFKAAKKDFVALFQDGANREDMGPKLAELRRHLTEQALSMLTEEQRARWKDMTGAPISGDLHFFGHYGRCRGHACARD